jgi:hypothetical protein
MDYHLILKMALNFATVIGVFIMVITAVCIAGFAFLGLASRMDDKAQLYSNQIGKPNDETKGETKA